MVDADPSRAGISILGLDIGGTKIASEVVTFLAGQISCDDFAAAEKPRLSQAKSIATEASRAGRAVLESVADLVEDQIRLALEGGKLLRGIANRHVNKTASGSRVFKTDVSGDVFHSNNIAK